MIKIYNTSSAEVAETVLTPTIFKGGEVSVQVPSSLRDFMLVHQAHTFRLGLKVQLNSSDAIMELLLTCDALRRIKPDVRLALSMYYVPYGRQDRVCNRGEALSIRVFADLINSLNFERVTILDPHSDVTPALIDRVELLNPTRLVRLALAEFVFRQPPQGKIWLVAPDAGAVKRVQIITKALQTDSTIEQAQPGGYFTASKVRDTATGEITETHFEGDVTGKTLMVVDDICDGGRTFIQLGEKLRAQGCDRLLLCVTHGIFSYGLKPLTDVYDHIYTTESWADASRYQDQPESDNVTWLF